MSMDRILICKCWSVTDFFSTSYAQWYYSRTKKWMKWMVSRKKHIERTSDLSELPDSSKISPKSIAIVNCMPYFCWLKCFSCSQSHPSSIPSPGQIWLIIRHSSYRHHKKLAVLGEPASLPYQKMIHVLRLCIAMNPMVVHYAFSGC